MPIKREVIVEKIDGTKETVFITALSVTGLYTFMEHMSRHDTPALIGLCVDKPRAWCDQLEISSFAKLVKIANELNFQKAADLANDDPAAMAMMMPTMAKAAGSMSDILRIGEGGVASLLKHALSGSAEAIGTKSALSHTTASSPS
jgi:hypothetical protein